jgi:hypothetical protein
MLDEQLHSCLICENPISDKTAVVDHCHGGGNVRALLCGQCNSAIGLLKHLPDVAHRAFEYLQKHIS